MSVIESPQISERPALLIDVDGVLRVIGSHPPMNWRPMPQMPKACFFYNPEHGIWIKELQRGADAYFMTANVNQAYDIVGRPLDIPEIPWINFEKFPRRDSDDNNIDRRAAVDHWFGGRAVAWIDDEFGPVDYAWAEERHASGDPTLLVQPDMWQGLEYRHVHEIRQWLGALATR